MGELYNCFKNGLKYSKRDWFMNKIGLVKFDYNDKQYHVFYTHKRANRYSIIHCKDNTIEWEQFPILPRIAGRLYGKKERIISLGASKEHVTIFVVMGKPNCITGLDEGIFRSIHKFDDKHINVMSVARFKEL